MKNQLILGDCLKEMKNIPDNSVDLIVTDPPYNIKKASWDNIKDYEEWCLNWILECQRVLKDNGSFYFFHNHMPTISKLMNVIKDKTNFIFSQLITWNKISPDFKNYGFVQQRLSSGGMRNYYNGFTEYCLFYTFQDETGLTTIILDINNFSSLRKYFKELHVFIQLPKKQLIDKIGHKVDHSFRYNSSQWDLPTKETYQELINVFKINEWEKFKEYKSIRKEHKSLRKEYEPLRYKFNMTQTTEDLRGNSNVWLYPPAKNIGHITPKPVSLIENIIKHSSNEGDLVLDIFAGSGTTAIACINTNRRYICIEKDKNYFDIMQKRISEIPQKLETF